MPSLTWVHLDGDWVTEVGKAPIVVRYVDSVVVVVAERASMVRHADQVVAVPTLRRKKGQERHRERSRQF